MIVTFSRTFKVLNLLILCTDCNRQLLAQQILEGFLESSLAEQQVCCVALHGRFDTSSLLLHVEALTIVGLSGLASPVLTHRQ